MRSSLRRESVESIESSVASSRFGSPSATRSRYSHLTRTKMDAACSPFRVVTPDRRMSSRASSRPDSPTEAMLAEAAEEAARAREQEEAHAAAKAAAEAALQDAKEQAERAATEHQEQIKVLEARVLELQESHDREMAMRIKDEAERTLEKVEELWRTSADNAKLKAENETYRQDKARSEVEAGILAEAFRAMEADSQSLIVDAAEAQLAVVQLESALASFNRHAVGVCYDQQGAGAVGSGVMPNRHRQQQPQWQRPTAAYRSNSPRFPNAATMAMHGAPANANAMLGEEARMRAAARRARHDLGLPPLCLSGQCSCGHKDFDALTRVLSAGISLGKRAGAAAWT